MRLFHAQVMDEHLQGFIPNAFCSSPWGYLFARAEALKFICIVDQVAGTLPTLTLTLFGGLANTNFRETTKTLLNAVALVGGTNTLSASFSPLDSTNPAPRFLRVQALLGGTNAAAHVQLWVCGRGPQLLEAVPATSDSFAAQYAAAQMIEDEDRLAMRKRTLKQGASLFSPPEVFVRSLEWKR